MTKEKVALIVAIAAGILSVVLLKAYVSSHKPKTITVMVAKEGVPKGTQFSEKLVTPKSVPVEGLNPRMVLTEAEFLARGAALQSHQAQLDIPEDAPILYSYFAIEEQTFSKTVPMGMRAVSLRVDEASGVAYALEPGDHVDVLVVYESREEKVPAEEPGVKVERGAAKSELLLEDATVLRAGSKWRELPEKGETEQERRYATVTLALTIPQAQQLLEAMQAGGTPALALRNPVEPPAPRRTGAAEPPKGR